MWCIGHADLDNKGHATLSNNDRTSLGGLGHSHIVPRVPVPHSWADTPENFIGECDSKGTSEFFGVRR